MRNDTPYSAALKKNAAGPTISNSLTPTIAPAPRPARVAASKRAEVLPRRTSLPAVAMAMNPRIEGTLAALEAPSRIARPAQQHEVRRQAGQEDRDGAEDRAVEHDPVVADPVRQDPEQRGQDELGQVEQRGVQPDHGAVDLGTAVLVEVGEVERQHRTREPGAEPERERAEQHGPQGSIHRAES